MRTSTLQARASQVFHEVQYEASKHGRYVASGWGLTVGVVGWSLGGGAWAFRQLGRPGC